MPEIIDNYTTLDKIAKCSAEELVFDTKTEGPAPDSKAENAKIVLSNDAYAICEFLNALINKK